MGYCTKEDVKTLLDMTTTHFDDLVAKMIISSDTFIDATLEGYTVSSAEKEHISLLYTASLVRGSIFETASESASEVSENLRTQALRLIRGIKEKGSFEMDVVND
jgi:hypothetical protein